MPDRRHPPTILPRSHTTMPWRRHVVIAAAAALPLAAAPTACLDRPVALQQPTTSRVSTVLYRSQQVDKIDLLFMIDNSASMGDKQRILAQAVPDLLTRLTTPRCIDVGSRAAVARDPATGQCPDGSEPEFEPVTDIHIGVISSSIGGHGSDACAPGTFYGYNPTQEDMSHLLTRGKSQPQVDTYQGKGYLQWDPEQKLTPPGTGKIEDLTGRFTDIVAGVGEQGCWYEASLEAWYRFLVDPAPYANLVKRPCDDAHPESQCVFPEGVDATVLTQRADFLRSDSLLVVIMLSDENDCSLLDSGESFLALQDKDGKADWHRTRPTDECAVDPDDPECTSCKFADPSRHPECASPDFPDPQRDDPVNLRCWDQKRRFGVNWLQPIRRYVDGLTRRTLPDGTINPLFCTAYAKVPDPGAPGGFVEDRTRCATAVRDERMVFLGGIIGVPWQDLARNPEDLNEGYLPAEQLAWTADKFVDKGLPVPAGVDEVTTLWNVMLGETDEVTFEVDPNSRPIDPLMIESVAARSGVNPATGKRLTDRPVPPGSADANPINGFERALPNRDDLQYACIFDLPEPVECAPSAVCDCHGAPENPLCWNDQLSQFGTTQLRAKAYPGTRQLAVLEGVGNQAIVASICPANVRDADPVAPDVQTPTTTIGGTVRRSGPSSTVSGARCRERAGTVRSSPMTTARCRAWSSRRRRGRWMGTGR